MSLTPVAPTSSGSGGGGLPSDAPRARSALRDRAGVPRVPSTAPLGAGVCVPRVRRNRGVAHRARALDVHGLWTSGVGAGGYHLPGHPDPVDALVPGDLVGGWSEERRQRPGPAARPRLGHGVSREHLDYYLDEFTFRFNRRTSRHRGKLFYRLLEQAVAVRPVPYAAMVKGIRGRKKKRHHSL